MPTIEMPLTFMKAMVVDIVILVLLVLFYMPFLQTVAYNYFVNFP